MRVNVVSHAFILGHTLLRHSAIINAKRKNWYVRSQPDRQHTIDTSVLQRRTNILAKCEFLNQTVVSKTGLRSTSSPRRSRRVTSGGMTILECSSGNTGIAMSMVGSRLRFPSHRDVRARQHRAPKIIEAFGGQVTPSRRAGHDQCWKGWRSPAGIKRKILAFPSRQFENPENALDHEIYGPGVLRQVPVPIDVRCRLRNGRNTDGHRQSTEEANRAHW